jgi:hypothetical protein
MMLLSQLLLVPGTGTQNARSFFAVIDNDTHHKKQENETYFSLFHETILGQSFCDGFVSSSILYKNDFFLPWRRNCAE